MIKLFQFLSIAMVRKKLFFVRKPTAFSDLILSICIVTEGKNRRRKKKLNFRYTKSVGFFRRRLLAPCTMQNLVPTRIRNCLSNKNAAPASNVGWKKIHNSSVTNWSIFLDNRWIFWDEKQNQYVRAIRSVRFAFFLQVRVKIKIVNKK